MHTLFIAAFTVSIFSMLALMLQLYQAQMKQQPVSPFWRWSLTSTIGQFLFFGRIFLRGIAPEAVCDAVGMIGCIVCIAGGVGVLRNLMSMRSETPQREQIANR